MYKWMYYGWMCVCLCVFACAWEREHKYYWNSRPRKCCTVYTTYRSHFSLPLCGVQKNSVCFVPFSVRNIIMLCVCVCALRNILHNARKWPYRLMLIINLKYTYTRAAHFYIHSKWGFNKVALVRSLLARTLELTKQMILLSMFSNWSTEKQTQI